MTARLATLTPAQAIARGRRLVAERQQAGAARARLWDVPGLVEKLRELWADSGRTANDIAAELSQVAGQRITRDALLGKVNRLGLTRSAPPPATGPARTVEAALRDKRGAQFADGSVRSIRSSAAKRSVKAVSLGGGESAIGIPITEQDQRVEAVTKGDEEVLITPVEPSVTPPAADPVTAADLRNRPRNMHVAMSVFPTSPEVPKTDKHPNGAWPIADLRQGQCRFACTPDHARPEDHRFCGRPARIGPGNRHGSWCPDHLALVWGRGSESERNAHRPDKRWYA